jgi:hypothetical protein
MTCRTAKFRMAFVTRDLARTKVNFACSRNDMQLFGLVDWKNLLLYIIEAMNYADI